MNFVYITTNIINGKQYIGSHATNNINDGYIGSGRIFLKAVNKYGKQNFQREILEECRNEETKNKISNTLKGRPLSDDTKKKLSEAGKRVKKITCEYCGKQIAPWMIDRHRKTHLR